MAKEETEVKCPGCSHPLTWKGSAQGWRCTNPDCRRIAVPEVPPPNKKVGSTWLVATI